MEDLNLLLIDLSPARKVLVDGTEVAYRAKPGDHIAVPFGGSWVEGVYTGAWHHGIYLGINDHGEPRAIDMSGRTDQESNIKEVTLSELRGGESVFAIVIYENDTDIKKEKTKEKAKLALETYKDCPADLYNVISSNCEHFATWCRTGRSGIGLVETYCKVQSVEIPLLRVCSSNRYTSSLKGGNPNGNYRVI